MAQRDLILVADCGTTGLKLGAVSREIEVVGLARASYPLHLGGPGCAEQDPLDWWRALRRAVLDLGRTISGLRRRAAAIIFSSQMCGVVCVDERGMPLRPCLVWLDKRSAEATRRIAGGFPEIAGYNAFRLATWLRLANGAPSHNGMDPPGKMLWVRNHEPEVWSRTCKFLDTKDWLVHRATGRFVTTYDSANLTWMMDSRPGRMRWSKRLMALVGVPQSMLPEIVDGSTIAGDLTGDAAGDLGLDAGVPVLAGCGDVCAAAMGSGATGDGELHIHMGTSAWIGGFYPARRLSVRHSYATIASAAGARPLLIATQESAGACMSWIAGLLAGETGGAKVDVGLHFDKIKVKGSGAAVPMFLPWLAGERVPRDDHRLRGAFLGLSLADDRNSLTRAVLEGVALNARWAFDLVSREAGTRTDGAIPLVGGAASGDAFVRILADCLGRELVVPERPVASGLIGAAKLASVGLCWSRSPWESAAARSDLRRVVPDPASAAYYAERLRLFLHAYRRTVPWFHRFHLSAFARAGSPESGVGL